MKELSLEEAALAWANNEEVEARPRFSKTWLKVSPVGFTMKGQRLSQSVFGDTNYQFRLAKKKGAK